MICTLLNFNGLADNVILEWIAAVGETSPSRQRHIVHGYMISPLGRRKQHFGRQSMSVGDVIYTVPERLSLLWLIKLISSFYQKLIKTSILFLKKVHVEIVEGTIFLLTCLIYLFDRLISD